MWTVAAVEVLKRNGGQPMHYIDIAKSALALGLMKTSAKRPENSLNVVLRKNLNKLFKVVDPGVYRLRPQT